MFKLVIKLFMQNLRPVHSKNHVDINSSFKKSQRVDINKLLNRVKLNNKVEKKKKFILLALAIVPIVITGLTVF